MGKVMSALTDKLIGFINEQQMFFTATSPKDGRINVSPKGLGSLRVISPNEVAYLDLTGSGNETCAHLHEDDRMTMMFCSFSDKPLILRLYGNARAIFPGTSDWDTYFPHFPDTPGMRHIILLNFDLVQTSCGFGVPLYTFEGQRDTLIKWAGGKGEDGLNDYRAEKNSKSLDGKPIPGYGI